MGNRSTIEWTDATWNPVTGCTKISAGCDHCYAERFSERFRGTPGHPFGAGFDLTLRPERLEQPFRWRQPPRRGRPLARPLAARHEHRKQVPLGRGDTSPIEGGRREPGGSEGQIRPTRVPPRPPVAPLRWSTSPKGPKGRGMAACRPP
jgi:hypothetical protein